MQAKFIDYGTRMEISFLNGGQASDVVINGSFYNTVGNTIALIEGKEIFEYCQTVWSGAIMECVFYMHSMKYSFNAEFMDTTVVNSVNLVRVKIVTSVVEVSQRSLPRIEISLPAKLTVLTEKKNYFECDAVTVDISLNAICVLATLNIPEEETPLEYKIKLAFGRTNFFIPVKLFRAQPEVDSKKYQNKYIFSIDFSEDKGLKDKLLFALFQHKKSS